ncbi:MAG: hypothetical protein FJX77_11110 [Armatimonadetes bacterium]|nr:hypothetical protein [Armatimonadota bacterium]
MEIHVPQDHGATEVLACESDRATVRPRRWEGDTYPALWFYFQVRNDAERTLPAARIVVEELKPGFDSYEPFWKHCLCSADGESWERIPAERQRFGETTLVVEKPLAPGEALWIAATFPLPLATCRAMSRVWQVAPPSGLAFEHRTLATGAANYPLEAFRIRRPDRRPRRNLVIVGGQHAVEQTGKLFPATVLDGYHSGAQIAAGSPWAELLEDWAVTVVPLANPQGCEDGRMNTNRAGIVVDDPADNSEETVALLGLLDELQPEVLVNCHGWGNEQGVAPYEDLYRWSDADPLFAWLRERVPGCSSSSAGHWLADRFRLECHVRPRYGTECIITELNWNWYVPPGSSRAVQPTREQIEARVREYFTEIARYCVQKPEVRG